MMKLLTLQFPPASCYILPPSSKYLPQYPVIEYCKFSGYVSVLGPWVNTSAALECSVVFGYARVASLGSFLVSEARGWRGYAPEQRSAS